MSPHTNGSCESAAAAIAIQIGGSASAPRQPGTRAPALYGNTNRARNGTATSAGGCSASAMVSVMSAQP